MIHEGVRLVEPVLSTSKKAPIHSDWLTCSRMKSAVEMDHEMELFPKVRATVTLAVQAEKSHDRFKGSSLINSSSILQDTADLRMT